MFLIHCQCGCVSGLLCGEIFHGDYPVEHEFLPWLWGRFKKGKSLCGKRKTRHCASGQTVDAEVFGLN